MQHDLSLDMLETGKHPDTEVQLAAAAAGKMREMAHPCRHAQMLQSTGVVHCGYVKISQLHDTKLHFMIWGEFHLSLSSPDLSTSPPS